MVQRTHTRSAGVALKPSPGVCWMMGTASAGV